MADTQQDREKKRAAAFPWLMRSGAPSRLPPGGEPKDSVQPAGLGKLAPSAGLGGGVKPE